MTPFLQAREAWEAAGSLRATRRRLKQFTYGRQWEAIADDIRAGHAVSDYEQLYVQSRCRPLTNNLIRSLVKSVVGRFRLSLADEAKDAGEAETRLRRTNRLDELDARALEEFIISGCAIQRTVYERRFEGAGVWVDNVNPCHFFVNRFFDPRGADIRLIGMLHDMSRPELSLRFAHGSRRRQRELDTIFGRSADEAAARPIEQLAVQADTPSFLYPRDADLCRVIEVWTFETDKRREPVWRCRFYAPDGTLLDMTRSPFPHGSHPFTVSLYPLTDGEVHPFIEDVIDQQRHINLLIATIDRILAHSAKGALMLPVDSVPAGMSIEEIAAIWSRPGAVIPVNPGASRMPEEVAGKGGSEGASQLLDLELRLFHQISGVTAALQGQAPTGHTSASLYESQVQNSAVALLDTFETFHAFRARRTAKALSIMGQR